VLFRSPTRTVTTTLDTTVPALTPPAVTGCCLLNPGLIALTEQWRWTNGQVEGRESQLIGGQLMLCGDALK